MSDDTNGATRLAELESDNRRLRRLLDQRDAPGELRHRLRTTVSMLRIVIRRSADTIRDLESYVGHVEDRLDALVRAQAAADDHGSVGLYMLLGDELLQYGASEGGPATLSGPDVELQPRAGQVFALAIHELAVNAVEHGALGTSTGRLEILWDVAAGNSEPTLTFSWKERDAANLAEPSHRGFGTEVLTRTLPYELEAGTFLAFEPDGLRCTISFPLTERIGRVAAG